jgi:AbrB family looped-hinge helix DNA binding protein
MVTTKVSKKYLTSVPSEIRKKFKLEVGDELEWIPMVDEIVVRPKKQTQKDPLTELIGLAEAPPSNITAEHNRILYGRG